MYLLLELVTGFDPNDRTTGKSIVKSSKIRVRFNENSLSSSNIEIILLEARWWFPAHTSVSQAFWSRYTRRRARIRSQFAHNPKWAKELFKAASIRCRSFGDDTLEKLIYTTLQHPSRIIITTMAGPILSI